MRICLRRREFIATLGGVADGGTQAMCPGVSSPSVSTSITAFGRGIRLIVAEGRLLGGSK
jgi:hypothetical protein